MQEADLRERAPLKVNRLTCSSARAEETGLTAGSLKARSEEPAQGISLCCEETKCTPPGPKNGEHLQRHIVAIDVTRKPEILRQNSTCCVPDRGSKPSHSSPWSRFTVEHGPVTIMSQTGLAMSLNWIKRRDGKAQRGARPLVLRPGQEGAAQIVATRRGCGWPGSCATACDLPT